MRAYHKKFYRPENLILTITGRIDEQQLFQTVRPIEEKILRKRLHKRGQEVAEGRWQQQDVYKRPWQVRLEWIYRVSPPEMAKSITCDPPKIA